MGYRYIRFFAECGYAGCDEEWYQRFNPDHVTDKDLDDFAEDMGREHCEHYEYLHTNDVDEDDYETYDDYETAFEEAVDDYWDNMAHWGWEEISPEEFYDNVDVMEE